MKRVAILVFSILQVALHVTATGHYTVIGPGTLHSARKYNVAVAVHQIDEPCRLKIGLTGPSYNETKTIDLEKDVVKNLEFDVPALKAGDYNLTAEGVSGLIFKNTTKLYYVDFKHYVKIQTDKATYKPGDVLNFRILFLDENFKPTVTGKDTLVWLEDGKRNRIKEFKDLKVVKGVYTGKFELSEYAVLGGWHLKVSSGERYPTSAYFKVTEYVLPKYTVNVEATESISVKDGDMQVVVRANYTYGKPVNAKVTLLLELNAYYSEEEQKLVIGTPPTLIRTADMVNGKAKFDLNLKEYVSFMPSKTSSFSLTTTATVEEHFTSVKINGTAYSSLYPYRYAMNCAVQPCSGFEADKELESIVEIKLVDGTPLNDTKSLVKLTYTESIKDELWWRRDEIPESERKPLPEIAHAIHEFHGHLNESSIVVFKVKLPDLKEYQGFHHYYKTEVSYADETTELYDSYQHRKPKDIEDDTWQEPKDYLKLNTIYEPEKYSVNLTEQVHFTVNSSEPLSYFIYTIVGRGNILHSEFVSLPDKPKIYNFTVKPTFEMSPYSNIYVFYVNDVGNFTYAETSLSVDVELQNQIEISAPEQVKPGENVELRIKTTPNSFVGLLAVDQSVLLLGGDNDISIHNMQYRLGGYTTSAYPQGGYSYHPGSGTGVVTLTNAHYFYNTTDPYGDHVHKKTKLRGHKKTKVPAENDVSYDSAVGSSDITVRKDFSEIWIFADIENTETEEFTWSKKIPDTITSWILTGFSLNPIKGLGLTKQSTTVTTFQPFFVAIRLPYSVKRGEVINVPALVFNYLDKDLDVEVTLDNTDGEFEFTEVSNEVIDTPKRTETVRVPANSAYGVSFMLRPKIVGNVMLKFTAISPVAGDAVHKTLKVVPEGITQYANRAYFVNLKDNHELKENFELQLPAEVVPDSEHIEFSVIGDLLGPVLNNLNNLVRLPLGCGEQTTSTIVPNILILRYLKATNKLTAALETKIKNNLLRGYQHILRYSHKDGSFSSFGPKKRYSEEKPHNGSTWLTAYVLRTLAQAKQFIIVDDKVLQQALAYLQTVQAANGSFIEHGDYFYRSQRDHLHLAASVVLAFHELGEYEPKYEDTLNKGYKYILDNWEKSNDLLVKAFATYTLHKAKHFMATNYVKQLKSLAKTEDDRMWWSHSEKLPNHKYIWWRWHYSTDVELTSYILLVLLDQEDETVDTVLPIIKWLVAQRNSYGGFSSTQDTVVGLKALTKFAVKFGYEPAVMDIDFEAKGGKATRKDTVKVTEDNALLMQINELPEKTRSVDFNAKGKGAALIQVSYQYNIFEKEKQPAFTINNVINKETPRHKLEMDICVEYTGEGDASNMAVLEVSLPSGYVADVNSFERIAEVQRVRQTEVKNGDTLIVIYFESLHKTELQCLPIEAFKSFAVALQKPAAIVLYDYYDTTKKATSYYEVDSKLCDLCDGDAECEKKCQ